MNISKEIHNIEIVKAIIAMADSLNIKVVVESVEDILRAEEKVAKICDFFF